MVKIKRVYLELTNRCNLNCAMCFRHTWKTVEGDMDLNLLKSLKNQLEDLPDLDSVFFGGIGEPTVYPHFKEAVDHFNNYQLLLTSNGIMDEEKAQLICENFSEVFFSFDQYHEGTPETKQILKQTFSYFKNYLTKNHTVTPRVGIAYVLTRSNEKQLFEVMDLMRVYGFRTLHLSHLMPLEESGCKEILYTRYENPEGKALLNRILAYFDINTSMPYMELKTERRCRFIDNGYIYIDIYGEVIPCYRIANSYDEYVFGEKKTVMKYSFGNVKETPLKKILESAEYHDFWNTVYNNQYPSCVDCDLKGGCSLVGDTEYDCYYNTPACSDCLWTRNFVRCP